MWRRKSVMLQKKLQELEWELSDAFSGHGQPDPNLMPSTLDDINDRLSFLSKLLAAELESCQHRQPKASDQLGEIDQRLTQLKSAFRDWNKSDDDTPSICSDCTQAAALHVVDSDKDEEKEERRLIKWRSKMGVKYYSCGAFVCGMIVGAICMALLKLYSSSHDHHHHLMIEYEAFLLPPT